MSVNGPVEPASQPQYAPYSATNVGLAQTPDVEAVEDVEALCDVYPVAEMTTVAPPTGAPLADTTLNVANVV